MAIHLFWLHFFFSFQLTSCSESLFNEFYANFLYFLSFWIFYERRNGRFKRTLLHTLSKITQNLMSFRIFIWRISLFLIVLYYFIMATIKFLTFCVQEIRSKNVITEVKQQLPNVSICNIYLKISSIMGLTLTDFDGNTLYNHSSNALYWIVYGNICFFSNFCYFC